MRIRGSGHRCVLKEGHQERTEPRATGNVPHPTLAPESWTSASRTVRKSLSVTSCDDTLGSGLQVATLGAPGSPE